MLFCLYPWLLRSYSGTGARAPNLLHSGAGAMASLPLRSRSQYSVFTPEPEPGLRTQGFIAPAVSMKTVMSDYQAKNKSLT